MTSRYSTNPETSTSQRYTVHEAALLLGLSVDAVRKRAERGSLKREKTPDGTVYIVLDTDQPSDESATGQGPLVTSLQDQIGYLRHELEIRNEELRRKDHLLAAAIERVPQLEAPSDASESSMSHSGGTGGEAAPQEKAREPTQRRSRLYRFFFGP